MSSPGVLETTRFVVDAARFVRIDEARLRDCCADWVRTDVAFPDWDESIHWSDGGPRTANYVLLLDALNFSFWGDGQDERWSTEYLGQHYNGYKALSVALKRAVEEDVPLTDAAFLADLSESQLLQVLRGSGEIPMVPQRLANAREVGQVLRDRFGGQFAAAIEGAECSAVALVETLVSEFSSFRDLASYAGREVRLLKRAQITVVDLFGTFGGKGLGRFDDLARLTAFADYKIPQVLRAQGILVYEASLAARVDSHTLLAAGCPEEVEIRAAMIWAVELISQELKRLGRPTAAYEIDWLLWNVGQQPVANEKPYHRTRTVFY